MSEYIIEMGDSSYQSTSGLLCADVSQLREEIVRCRDCVGMVETWDGYECERFSGEYHRAEPDGFCAWGERREP